MTNEYDALLQEYRKLAKQADQRLVRLEKLSMQEHYHGIRSFAYARAARDIAAWDGRPKDKPRFNTKPPKNLRSLQAKVNDIKQFLDAPTSQKSSIKKIYKQKADTTNKNFGTNFTWEDIANYYESNASEKLAATFGSKMLVKALGVIKKLHDEEQQIEKSRKDHVRKISDDDVVAEVANKIMDMGYTYEDLFGDSDKKVEYDIEDEV